jgi:hypothetical protein
MIVRLGDFGRIADGRKRRNSGEIGDGVNLPACDGAGQLVPAIPA